jgi:hypothetical protein
MLAGQAADIGPGVGGDLVRLGGVQVSGDPRQQIGLALEEVDALGQRRVRGDGTQLIEEGTDLAGADLAG